MLLAVAVLVLFGAVAGWARVSDDISPSAAPGAAVTVVVAPGSSSLAIAHVLARSNVISDPDIFALYVKLEASGPLLAGTYRFNRDEGFAKAMRRLEKGPAVSLLVVPEGFTVRQMAAAVAKLPVGITSHDFMVAATSGAVRSPYEPASTDNLEGLLFPATYPVVPGETADELVGYMVQTFDQHASAMGLAAAASKLHMTPYEVVTVASIVEREAKLEVDRGPIASVIYNRLAIGMPIGAESTLLYGLGAPSGPVDITEANPYNTLVNRGLPPTPISSPGAPSLEAAMAPPKTTYLYWVEVDRDGKMGFASTTAGFKQLQHECNLAHLGC